jgi:hypothetical protein
MLADSRPIVACIKSTTEYFSLVAYTFWQSASELFLPVGCVSRDMRIHIVMSAQLFCVQLFRPLIITIIIIIIIGLKSAWDAIFLILTIRVFWFCE